ncbi:MAG: hypothetical protein KatS3mg061_0203 [Dehalococcoidia bacterium]|nr:MAG: hypothetical protein KatS3mg061_0203 [Dehalococcoidia bacterium]
MPIRVLDPTTAARIAAGEVIERPASVVKELVENALDAGARTISVELRAGGAQLIRVTDDGCGIPEAEIELAFERHATSKLTSFDDLERVATLGFRGEALPSIRAVAEVSIISRPLTQEFAAYRRWERGQLVERGRRSAAPGTQLTVRQLFADLPARRQQLRSPASEAAHCAQVVSHYALARPEVRFTLTVDGRTTLRTPGSGVLDDAALAVLGRSVVAQLLPVDSRQLNDGGEPVAVVGLVSRPTLSRANRGGLMFFLNGRWVQSRLLMQAVEAAYHTRLMVGRHPVAVLHVALPPQAVDVNVHPAKTEVRLRCEGEVFRTVERAVRAALAADSAIPALVAGEEAEVAPAPWEEWPAAGPAEQLTLPTLPPSRLPVLRLLGQVGLTYLVAEGPDGVYLVDQHAAHERVLFDRLQAAWARGTIQVQGLLDPLSFPVNAQQLEAYEQLAQTLAQLGFQIERHTPQALLVRAVPAALEPARVVPALEEILSLCSSDPTAWRDQVAASVACHAAVRAGQALSDQEMRALLRQLEETDHPKTCPHGRPTMMHLSATQLARLFGRLG